MSNHSQTVVIPKKLKEITDLYRACQFEKADLLLDGFDKLPHQKSAIKAQLSFFKWDFDTTVELILSYFEFLDEWYSANVVDDTVLMLEYALLNCDENIKNKAIQKLSDIYREKCRENENKNEKLARHIQRIPRIIEIATSEKEYGLLGSFTHRNYQIPDDPKSLDEIVAIYKEHNESACKKIKGDLLNSEKGIINILNLVKDKGDPQDFVTLYKKVERSTKMSMYISMDAIRIFRYLNRYHEAKQAIIDLVKYRWHAVEWTDVMPVSALVGIDCFDLYDEELFTAIYNIPKDVEQSIKNKSKKLEFNGDFEKLFKQTEFSGFQLNKKIISKLSVPTGKLIVADPLVWLNDETKPFVLKVPKGEYDVVALIACKDKCAPILTSVMVRFTEGSAVIFRNALIGNETQSDIDELKDGGYFGFHVSCGLASIMDKKASKEFIKFRNKWEKENKSKDFYSGYLKELFDRSAAEEQTYQRECGDHIDLIVPNTNYHMPIFASGSGNGYYPVYFGYDAKGDICSIVVEFVETY